MKTRSLPATFARSGTSNGLLLHAADLPGCDPAAWQPILSAAMGSPDPQHARQLDGMGQGSSSTSKVCVVARSEGRADADVDFTFVQVGIARGELDLAGNCGNMSAAIGPWAMQEGLVDGRVRSAEKGSEKEREATVRIWNTNTQKLIVSRFAVDAEGKFEPGVGDYAIDGVPGTGTKITLEFVDPAGAKTGVALPTGNSIDVVEYAPGESIRASLVDVANPGVFVLAADLGVSGTISPAGLEKDANMMTRLEQIRRRGAEMMGMDPEKQTVPKILLLSTPDDAARRSGINIVCRALSMQQPHRAVPLTLALNLGTACKMASTLPAITAVDVAGDSVTVAHASGKVEVGCTMGADGSIKSALLHRTARVLMKGDVFYSIEE